jgi:hypothetical protein
MGFSLIQFKALQSAKSAEERLELLKTISGQIHRLSLKFFGRF